ncbi:hypothetical protein Tco_0260707 [Tanacetum coccineum]
MTNAEQDDEDEEDAHMIDVAHVQVEQTQEQTTGIQEESGPEMASVQGQYVVQATTTSILAIYNATTESTETEVVSMMDINVQHEVPHTSPLLTILVYVIPKHIVFNPSETVTTAPVTTITSLLLSLFPNLHQSTPIPTPTNTEATTSTPFVLESESLNAIHLRLSDLEKEVKELKNVLKKHDADIIKEFPVPAEIVERLTQQYLPQQSTEKSTEDIRKIKMKHASVTDKLKKTKPDDTDKDKGPSTRSDRGLKRQRKSKGTETSKKTSTLKGSSKGKSPSTSLKSSKSGKSAKDQVEEPIFVQTRLSLNNDLSLNNKCAMDHEKTWVNPMNNLTNFYDGMFPKYDFWLNDMAKATKPPLTFDELMHTPIEFSSFAMNHLKIDNLAKEHLVGLVYNLLKGTCKSYVELDYTMEECYRALSEQLNWNNPMVIVVNEWYGYGHVEEIVVKRADQQLCTFKEGDFKRLHLNDIEYMLLLVVQNKLNNLDGNFVVHLAANLHKLHKFSDGTLISVCDTLSQMLHALHLGYNKTIRRRQWTSLDQQRTRIMIKAINQKLLDRRIMMSLEKFIGGREYGEDLRLLQRTIHISFYSLKGHSLVFINLVNM